MEFTKNKRFYYVLIGLFIIANAYFILKENYLINLLPLLLIIIYIALFHTKLAFMSIILLTPLSINLGEMMDLPIGVFVPTEPLLIGLLFLALFMEIKNPTIVNGMWNQPLTKATLFYLSWILVTAIMSESPLISFKFLFMKLWYIIPIFILGYSLFKEKKNITLMMWCYSIALSIVIIYTLIHHAEYSFREKEGHWVMYPFFKDHTIYGACTVISLFFISGLLFYKKHNIQNYLILITMLVITGIGVYFSYSRAAWISVLFAMGVLLSIRLKIKFKFLLIIGIIGLGVGLLFQHEIELALAKNKYEHTTTNFEERIQSSINYTTDLSNLERINRYEATWNMVKEKPFFGFGPGTYAFEYAPYQNPESLTLISTNFGDNGNAHSEYLGPMAESGFIGLISILAFVSAFFHTGITTSIKYRALENEKELYILLISLVLASASYFFHGLINNFLDTDKAAIPIYCMAIIFIAQSERVKGLIKGLS